MTKLQKKLARQAKTTERLMGNYTVGSKKGGSVRFANNGLWKHNDLPKVKQNIL